MVKSLNSSDEGYGLQNPTARGSMNYNSSETRTCGVAFSGTTYWYDSTNSQVLSEYNHKFDGSIAGAYDYVYIYDPNLSNYAPDIIHAESRSVYRNNGYTIAYYVNNYVNTLKDLGAPNSITGRLLAYEEAYALGCRKYDEPCLSTTPSWLLYTNFYLGSARNAYPALISLGHNRDYYINNNYGVTTSSGETGVRPVIVVPTNEMPS